MTKPTIICLTPVKNEAWILDRFLKCASLWADHIIVADQSDDDSAEIARRYPKVILVHNPAAGYDEPARQKLMLEAARKIPGSRLLITLDADEAFTANFMTSPEWQDMLTLSIGTVIRFKWANLMNDMEHYWDDPWDHAWGFMDDGTEPKWDNPLHNTRIPIPSSTTDILMREVKVMHYQFTEGARRESKWRFYQCFERMMHSERSAIEICRRYREPNIRPDQIRVIPGDWLQGYRDQGINMTSIQRTHRSWWDKEVLDMLDKYGAKHFRRQNVWSVDWNAVHREIYGKEPDRSLSDPRSKFDKWVHRWLEASQTNYNPYNLKLKVRIIEKGLRLLGW